MEKDDVLKHRPLYAFNF